MNRYRAYMNRIHAPSGLRHRVLEAAERGRPRPSCARHGSGRGAPRSLPRARRQEAEDSRPSSAAARGLGLAAARSASLPSRGR